MKKLLALVFAAALLACSGEEAATPVASPAETAPSAEAESRESAFPDDDELLALISSRVEDGRTTGVVLGVMDADGSTRIVSYGDPGPGAQPLGPDSVFEIGSITKVFTATSLADMAAKGEVDLDAPAQNYAPDGLILPTSNGKEITLANLSMHNSGLPRLPDNMDRADPSNPYADYTVAQLHEFVSNYELPRDPGEETLYSNLGVGMLGHILAHHAGMSYEELVRERVLAPLGMDMTAVTLTPGMQAALAVGHDESGAVTSNWDIATLTGAGGLRSNMTDMLKFLDANMGQPMSDLERVMRDAHTPRAGNGAPNEQIGLNWITRTTSGGINVVHHGGNTGGYRSFLGFDAKRDVGVVLLANQTGVESPIAFHLLDPSLPLTPIDFERVEIELPVESMEKFVGRYASDAIPDSQLVITIEDGALFAQAAGVSIQFFPESDTQVFATIIDMQLTFVFNDDGEVTGLIQHRGPTEYTWIKIE